METEILEYELIDIEFELNYEDVAMPSLRVCEDDVEDTGGKTPEFEYDENGIPKGQTIEEIKIRESLILDFLRAWSAINTERKVFNDILQEWILVRAISIVEAKEHSAIWNNCCESRRTNN